MEKEIIHDQVDIQFEHFMEEEVDAILKKIKIRKIAGLGKISSEV